MEKGISLYPGLGMTREELVGRVEQAAQKRHDPPLFILSYP